MKPGDIFRNGVDGLHSVGTNWGEALTVVRKDTQSYGVDRYVVRDKYGRIGYAY